MNRRTKTILLTLCLLLSVSLVAQLTGWSAKAMEQSRALSLRLTKLITTSSKAPTSHSLPESKSSGKVKAAAASAPMAPAMFASSITVDSTAQEETLANPTGITNGNCTLGEAILAANSGAAVD